MDKSLTNCGWVLCSSLKFKEHDPSQQAMRIKDVNSTTTLCYIFRSDYLYCVRVPVVRRTRQPIMFFRDVTDTNQSESQIGHQQLRFTRNYMGAWRTCRRPPTSSLLLDWLCRQTRRRRDLYWNVIARLTPVLNSSLTCSFMLLIYFWCVFISFLYKSYSNHVITKAC